MSTDFPNAEEEPDTAGKTTPPYDDRQKSGEVDSKDESTKDGVKTAGATGPVEDDEMKAGADPSAGSGASPADEE